MAEFIKNKCPICRNSSFRIIGSPEFGTIDVDKPKESKIVKCKNCKTIYVNPMPIWTKEDFSKLYNDAEDYFSVVSKSSDLKEKITINRRFKLISQFLKTTNRNCFEIGAGIHALMAKFLSKNNWNIVVQEPSKAFAAELKKNFLEFNIIESDFGDISEEKKYSLIYADSVFEHVHNPGDYIKKSARLLESGGILYFITPNEYSAFNMVKTFINKLKGGTVSYICPYTISFHLLGFSKKGIKILAEEADLEIVKLVRGYDYEWRRLLKTKKTILKYPAALLFYIADLLGWGTNQEILLRKLQ